MQEEIINRVASSGLVTIDLEQYYPKGDRILLDIKPWLFQEMILKERDFRQHLKEHDWSQYEGGYVAITCSVDAIIPTWAYMLIVTKLKPYVVMAVVGDHEDLERSVFQNVLASIDVDEFKEKKIVIKGCSDQSIPQQAYAELTSKLLPHASSIMFGEPCSTVPVYKKPRK